MDPRIPSERTGESRGWEGVQRSAKRFTWAAFQEMSLQEVLTRTIGCEIIISWLPRGRKATP
jgi:hypothetical protein